MKMVAFFSLKKVLSMDRKNKWRYNSHTIMRRCNQKGYNTMSSRKEQLIQDIQNLLNRYGDVNPTTINPALLSFMDEDTLLKIINSLLKQQEKTNEDNVEWVQQFKK